MQRTAGVEPEGFTQMLHITDGESVAGTLRESGIPGVVATYGDLMYEGPAPAGLDEAAWCDVRARFIAEAGYATLEEARRFMNGCAETLAACAQHEGPYSGWTRNSQTS